MPKVNGGTRSGRRKSSTTSRFPGKSRRASAYAAGTPMSPENATTRKTTWKVTVSTSPSWNSSQAEVYHRVVHPTGSQVPSQRVANELVTTVAIIANRLSTKNATSTQTAAAQSFARTLVSRIIEHSPQAPLRNPLVEGEGRASSVRVSRAAPRYPFPPVVAPR
jgi:hypothetical protein